MSLLTYANKFIRRQRARRFHNQMEQLRREYPETVASVATMQNHRDFDLVRQRIRGAGTASLSHFGNQYTHEGGYFLQQNPDEFTSLILFLRARSPFANYLEIGSASGGTCLLLCQNVEIRRVISLDDGCHRDAWLQDGHFAQIPHCDRFLGDSHGEPAREYLQQNVREPLDVAFIDGDHSYEGVKQDIELVLPFCRRGTLMVLHDTIACDGVAQAWCDIIRQRKVKPVAEFIGAEKPLGIAVAEVL